MMWFLMRPPLRGSAAFRSHLSSQQGFSDQGRGGGQFEKDPRLRAGNHFQLRIMSWQGRVCVEGKRRNQLPLYHTPIRKGTWPENTYLDARRCELCLMKQLTTQHGIKEAGQRRERLKGWGYRLEWLKETGIPSEHNRLISERHWEGIRIFSWSMELLSAPFCSSHLEKGWNLCSNMPQKEEVTSRREEERNLEMSLSPERRKKSCPASFSALAAATSFNPDSCVWCWRAEMKDI